MTLVEAPPDQPCPTPPPLGEVSLPNPAEGFEPEPAVRAICEAFAIVDDQLEAAYREFEAPGFFDDADAMGRAGERIVAAGVEIEGLVGDETSARVAADVRAFGEAFQEEGRRAGEGDLSDRSGRQLFHDLGREYSQDCFGRLGSDRLLTRAELASWFVDEFDLPATDDDAFTDDDGTDLEDAINRAAAAGVVTGCSETIFCGDDFATRGLMATLLARALDLPATEADAFGDDSGSRYEEAINRIAAAGLVAGHRSGAFRPEEGLTIRMAQVFLSRARRL